MRSLQVNKTLDLMFIQSEYLLTPEETTMSLKTQTRRTKEAAFQRTLRDLAQAAAVQRETVRAEVAAMSEGF